MRCKIESVVKGDGSTSQVLLDEHIHSPETELQYLPAFLEIHQICCLCIGETLVLMENKGE